MEKSKQIKATITKNLFFFLLFLTGITNAQIVNIPDANFKAALIAYGVDANNDGQIQVSEAQAMNTLQFTNPTFTDATGLESFINLQQFNINNSLLTSLDLSPLTQLQSITCNGNSQLTNINLNGLTNLTSLTFQTNTIINSIDLSNLTSLYILNCVENSQLSSVDLTGTNNISQLTCSYNNLISMDVSNSSNLITLNCSYNQLTSIDITNCPVLDNIIVEHNNLSSLDLSGLNSINFLHINNNLISTIIIPENITISDFFASNNQFESIDFSTTYLPGIIDLSNNPLKSMNLKNGYNEVAVAVILTVTNLPIFICQDDNQIVSFNSAFANNGWTSIILNSYCTFTPGGNYNTITGNIKFDADNNGCDDTDLSHSNIRVNVNDGTNTGASFTNNTGNYTFYTQAGNFTLTPSIENPSWFTFSPLSATIPFANNDNNIATQDFCFTANGVHNDLEVIIVPITPARPGFDAVYKLSLRNKGNQTLNSWTGLLFNYDATKMSFVSSSTLADTTISGQLGFGYFINPFETISTEITFHINSPTDNPPVNIGDILNFTSSITIANDELPADNVFNYNQTVIGSYDPNNIICIEGEVVPPTEIGNYLHYVVNFENTGTAPAENVVVKVVVNTTDFDMDSLQLMNTSHPVDARINGNVVEFIFQSINLDSGGHGNVLLKIKSKNNLQQGDVVEKKADIYFDYNFPIATNDYETTFQLLSNPDVATDNSVSIYPNPARNNVNITSKNTIKTIELYDVQGRVLQSQVIDSQSSTMDISSKSKGVYFLKVVTEKGIKVEKLVKN
ncbi:MAG: T9SS type A sorting domain-containing protein [Flavobacteriaceae bacterium]